MNTGAKAAGELYNFRRVAPTTMVLQCEGDCCGVEHCPDGHIMSLIADQSWIFEGMPDMHRALLTAQTIFTSLIALELSALAYRIPQAASTCGSVGVLH